LATYRMMKVKSPKRRLSVLEWIETNMPIPCNIDDPTGEPSRARLVSLQAVLKMLIESPRIERDIDEEDVREACYSRSDFTTSECQVASMIANTLGPYIPKRRPNLDGNGTQESISHVALRAPLVTLANAVLRAAGYPAFARKIAPEIPTSSLHSLALGAAGIYEVLCSAAEDQFDVVNADGSPLTQQMQISQHSGNKRAIMGSFFDVERIDEIYMSAAWLAVPQQVSDIERSLESIAVRIIH